MTRSGDDSLLREAVAIANIPTLLLVVAQLTGDRTWLEPPYCPRPSRGVEDNDSGGLAESIQETVRAAAVDAISEWRSGRPIAWESPTDDELREMLSVGTGEIIPDEYSALLGSEMFGRGTEPDLAPAPPGFSVVVVGAGFAGLIAAYRLQQAGISFCVIERNESVGGTWFENRYPGAGVDTPSHLYSLSFAHHDWPSFFALHDEVRDYLESTADRLGLRQSIKCGLEVEKACYDEAEHRWRLSIRDRDGAQQTIDANVLISAVGIFNPPKVPDIPGLDTFSGAVVHTARWPDDLDLTDQRVAVVGTGASAMQVVPAIADRVRSLTIFQRSQQWALPFPRFRESVPASLRWLMQEVPLYERWYRARLGWTWNDRVHPSLTIDPDWNDPEHSINATNDRTRAFLTDYIRKELGERPDLADQAIPTYPPFGKRMLLDNGWFRTLGRDHVELVTAPIQEVHSGGIVTADGTDYVADLVILATGFDVARFLSSFPIEGRDGKNLQESWGDDGRAYLGTTVPGYPNFFCLYGPNLQPGHGGSVIATIERQMHHVLLALNAMFRADASAIEVDEQVCADYNSTTDAALSGMIWTHTGMRTYYRNDRGRIVVNSPYRHSQWWHMTKSLDDGAYRIEKRGEANGPPPKVVSNATSSLANQEDLA